MSEFLRKWDAAIEEAKQDGCPVLIWHESWSRREPGEPKAYNLYPVARTMHPAFMAARPVKHDPERDKWDK